MNEEIIRKGTEIIESCLGKCERVRISVDIFRPNQDIMDILLAKDYLKLRFNNPMPNDNVLIFHNSEDEYAHNGDISFTCFLSQVPKVLECVREHKKIIALIKEIKKERR